MCLGMWFYNTLVFSLRILSSCQLASHLLYTFSSGWWCWTAKWRMSWCPGVKSTADPRERGEGGVTAICVLSCLFYSSYVRWCEKSFSLRVLFMCIKKDTVSSYSSDVSLSKNRKEEVNIWKDSSQTFKSCTFPFRPCSFLAPNSSISQLSYDT